LKTSLKRFSSIVAFAACSAFSAAAFAGTALLEGLPIAGDGSEANPYDIGVLPSYPPNVANLQVAVTGSANGSFEEYVNFSAPADSTGLGSASSLSLTFGADMISNLFIEVWDQTHPAGINLIGTFSGDNLVHSFLLSSGGQYHLDVSGTLGADGMGSYGIGMAVAAIPEPETYAMLLAGLGLMGFVARRRQRNLVAA